MMARARESGRGFILSHDVTIGDYDESWLEMLKRHELDNIAAHGLRGSDGRLKSFFGFFKVTGTICDRLLYLLEVLLPILDSTLSRVVASQAINDASSRSKIPALGDREIQVIKLIKVGKTNQVIADELFISPKTVKNHVQNILKKLQVKTRGHAVAKAIDLGLLKS
jgi:transcriptional regulator EpsA